VNTSKPYNAQNGAEHNCIEKTTWSKPRGTRCHHSETHMEPTVNKWPIRLLHEIKTCCTITQQPDHTLPIVALLKPNENDRGGRPIEHSKHSKCLQSTHPGYGAPRHSNCCGCAAINYCTWQGCHGDGRMDMSVRPTVTSDKALVCPLRKYSSIFEHILENIQRIYQLRPSVTSLYDRFIPASVIYDNPGTWARSQVNYPKS
jgi:hypothetical protein